MSDIQCNNIHKSIFHQVVYNNDLFRTIVQFMPLSICRIFIQVSKEHRDMALEYCICQYITHIKDDFRIPVPYNLSNILTTSCVSDTLLTVMESYLPPLIIRREPIPSIFKRSTITVHPLDFIGVDERMSSNVLLHMDQCMHVYSTGTGHETFTELLNVAHSYITREDINCVNDVQSHHRYVIMKSWSDEDVTAVDHIMTEIFASPSNLELVIDFEENKRVFHEFCSTHFAAKFGANNCIEHVSIIGKNLTAIGFSFLSYCRNIKTVTLPHTITEMGGGIFEHCNSLTHFHIPNNVKEIDEFFMCACYNLKSIKIPNSMTSINNDFMIKCTSLTSIYIPNSVNKIGNGAFTNCSKLASITLPSSVTSIGDFFMQNCTALTSLDVPSSVTQIRNSFLVGCTSLTHVTFPSSVTSIGNYCIYPCHSLKSMIVTPQVQFQLRTSKCTHNSYLGNAECIVTINPNMV